MDLTIIQGTLGGLKTAFDIAKGIADLKSMTDVQGKVIELQQAILAAQSSAMAANAQQYAAADELRALRDELERAKGWQTERQRYRLFQFAPGRVAFALRKSQAQESEPPHYLCANCFEQGRKSILNNSLTPDKWTYWRCAACKSEVPTGLRGGVSAEFAPD
jgi:hypothetical protein